MKRVMQEKKTSRSPKRQHHSEIEKKPNGIHIPLDLKVDILSRLPVKSLVRFHKSCDDFFGYDPVEKHVFTLLGGPKKQHMDDQYNELAWFDISCQRFDRIQMPITLQMNQLWELTLVNYKGKLGCISYTNDDDCAEMWIMEDHHHHHSKKLQEWSKIEIDFASLVSLLMVRL
ncbi:hypothetical protein EUTSA_v10005626mg [Eutrema salsugineum]|uniref:F-box associated beta-propeller type 3 domain-containing protein n=1 Tax=Eutrema salsugineum TaxID=72664 RepID=V4K170_EUTSA|nr:hypothetical protein EUTSA_v10005626mg [Eutrema salsugineum]